MRGGRWTEGSDEAIRTEGWSDHGKVVRQSESGDSQATAAVSNWSYYYIRLLFFSPPPRGAMRAPRHAMADHDPCPYSTQSAQNRQQKTETVRVGTTERIAGDKDFVFSE